MITEGWLVIYMDDLLITSFNPTIHAERTHHVLQRMTELDLHLKLEKCQFNVPEVKYLGMIIKPGQLAMDPVKLDGITTWPTPTKVKDVRSFLSFANSTISSYPTIPLSPAPSLISQRKTTSETGPLLVSSPLMS